MRQSSLQLLEEFLNLVTRHLLANLGVYNEILQIEVTKMKSTKQLTPILVTILVLSSFVPGLTHQVESSGHATQVGGSNSEHNVKAFGATGDGKTLDTTAINKAIEQAAAGGGGTVRFPAGNYLSFSIRLKSNIALFLDHGATIVAADPKEDDGKYDPPEPNQWDKYQDFGHSHWHNSLIWGENLTNVSILGPGMIWGKGLVRSGGQSRTQEQNDALNAARANEPKTPFGYPNPRDAVEPGWGNKSIALKICRNVNIRDITILHGGILRFSQPASTISPSTTSRSTPTATASTLMHARTCASRTARSTRLSTTAFVRRVRLRSAMRARLKTSRSRIAR